MGWLIIGILFLVLSIVLLVTEIDEEGILSGVLMGVSVFVLIFTIIGLLCVNCGKDSDYNNMYTERATLIERVNQYENKDYLLDEELIDDINYYNSQIHAAKNEGFMTKFLHNPRYKELDYIKVDGIAPIEDKK